MVSLAAYSVQTEQVRKYMHFVTILVCSFLQPLVFQFFNANFCCFVVNSIKRTWRTSRIYSLILNRNQSNGSRVEMTAFSPSCLVTLKP